MTSGRLQEHLRAYYLAQRPSEGLLDRMRAISELEEDASERGSHGWSLGRRLLLSGVLAAGVALVVWSSQTDGPRHDTISGAVAREVALNHQGHYEPDVTSTEFMTVVAALDRLDFKPVLPERAADLVLVGARYCSLQGQIAAQLQFRDDEGRRFTLYEARHGERIGALPPRELELGATHVEIWSENGLVFGLASTPEGRDP